jgi:hypothetical protein
LFNNEDLGKLDGGYSVSDSADDYQSLIGGNLADGSALIGRGADASPNSPPHLGGSMGPDGGADDMDGGIEY